tara:strand:- start:387 stop:524 length:138 start_codon:yes stop_codon:yes gene_type:complete
MYQKLSPQEHTQLLDRVGQSYLPKEKKKKPKLTLKQLFFLKKKGK